MKNGSWTKENKRTALFIAAVILVLFVILLMLKFWVTSLVLIGTFVIGFYFGRKSTETDEDDNSNRYD